MSDRKLVTPVTATMRARFLNMSQNALNADTQKEEPQIQVWM